MLSIQSAHIMQGMWDYCTHPTLEPLKIRKVSSQLQVSHILVLSLYSIHIVITVPDVWFLLLFKIPHFIFPYTITIWKASPRCIFKLRFLEGIYFQVGINNKKTIYNRKLMLVGWLTIKGCLAFRWVILSGLYSSMYSPKHGPLQVCRREPSPGIWGMLCGCAEHCSQKVLG